MCGLFAQCASIAASTSPAVLMITFASSESVASRRPYSRPTITATFAPVKVLPSNSWTSASRATRSCSQVACRSRAVMTSPARMSLRSAASGSTCGIFGHRLVCLAEDRVFYWVELAFDAADDPVAGVSDHHTFQRRDRDPERGTLTVHPEVLAAVAEHPAADRGDAFGVLIELV